MSFVFAFALLAVVLVAAPYLAHRLRRHRAEARPFAPAFLVPPAKVRARRPAGLEDRALFATRVFSVVALAMLGASPLVQCSRLSVTRSMGASVALVVILDDSMSMRASLGSRTRFARAREGAAQLLASTREGDSVAIVLAGEPARVALAPTTDLRTARATVEAIPESDRATDLDPALAMAGSLLEGLPQADRRVVVLSDLADGRPDAPPLGEGSAVPVWNALPEIRADGQDCGVVRAERAGSRVRVRVACTPVPVGSRPPARKVGLYLGEKRLVEGPVPAMAAGDVSLVLPAEAVPRGEDPGALVARLDGKDAIAADDAAPVVSEAAPGSVAVVVPVESETAATGGAPVVEQALRALALDVAVRPLPQIPDRTEDLGAFEGVLLDDPPGLTPEERRALGTFVQNGGVLLLALGPRAAAPPLGASLEPFLEHAVAWESTASPGADPATASSSLVESAASLRDIGARRRAVMRREDAAAFSKLLEWTDHAPFVARRAFGRGEVWVVTLPFALDASDLPVRPAFLALLEAWLDAGRARSVPRRTEVGLTWLFPGAHRVTITGPQGEDVPVVRDGATLRAAPSRVGVHRLEVDGRREVRVAEPATREIDLRPRKLSVAAAGKAFGANRAAVDASPVLAFALLALLALELALRVWASASSPSGRREREATSSP